MSETEPSEVVPHHDTIHLDTFTDGQYLLYDEYNCDAYCISDVVVPLEE